MMISLAPYQQEAVNKVTDAIKELLFSVASRNAHGDFTPARIVLKSPTGSGKTIMAAEVLRSLTNESLNDEYVYIWAAPNKLHTQSYRKLSESLIDTQYLLQDVETLEAGALAENTILFANWEKLFSRTKDGQWRNKAVRRGETGQNLQNVLEDTRAAGRKIILIVDESHQTFFGTNSQLLTNEVIQPCLIMEISATPKMTISGDDSAENRGRQINVRFSDVVDSGLIKSSVIINPGIENYKTSSESSLEAIIQAALDKQKELKDIYTAQGSIINPLILVQLPSEMTENLTELDIRDKELVEAYLLKQGLSYGGGEVAIWLSDDKKNLADIEAFNSEVKVLIFKQAIALGWDCPRAQILVMLRDIKSDTFRIQTVGRILRMPELHHYNDDRLNTAYVYTNLDDVRPDPNDVDAKNLIKIFSTYRRPDITNIQLTDSIYLQRIDYGDLRADFAPILKNILDQYFDVREDEDITTFKNKIDDRLEIYDEELVQPIIADTLIENLDTIDQTDVSKINFTLDTVTIERTFNTILRSLVMPYKNFSRSKGIVAASLYSWFYRAGFNELDVQKFIACSLANQHYFKDIFDKALDAYDDFNKQEMSDRRQRNEEWITFEIPADDEYTENYTWIPAQKNVMTKFFRKENGPQTEVRFEDALENSPQIDWWYKNGEKMRKYFAVAYDTIDLKGKVRRDAFYPDYIVRFIDGSVGIYETKSGITVTSIETKLKAEALQRYIAEHSSTAQVIKGGIIDATTHTFTINTSTDYRAENTEQWLPFHLN